jgi:endonuclease-8
MVVPAWWWRRVAEGDSIVRMARRIEAAFEGREVLAAEAPNPRSPLVRSAGRLAGHSLLGTETRGKHLLLNFSPELVLHAHMGMSGGWYVYRQGQRWRRLRRSAWLVMDLGGVEVVQFGGPTLRLVRPVELARDTRLASLGPDILGGPEAVSRAASNLAAAGRVELGEALLNQRLVAGIGNIFKSESCFEAGLDPWRLVSGLDESQIRSVLEVAASQMERGVETGRRPGRIYRKSGEPCPGCGGRIRSRGQGDDNRTTYWCPSCQS